MNTTRISFPEGIPLVYDASGTIRVINSRITLDTLANIFKRGDTVEEIAEGFPTLSLEQIKTVISWYLTHEGEAEEYLQEGYAAEEKLRKELENRPGYAEYREMLRRRAQLIKT